MKTGRPCGHVVTKVHCGEDLTCAVSVHCSAIAGEPVPQKANRMETIGRRSHSGSLAHRCSSQIIAAQRVSFAFTRVYFF
jgi:hypothetical protein